MEQKKTQLLDTIVVSIHLSNEILAMRHRPQGRNPEDHQPLLVSPVLQHELLDGIPHKFHHPVLRASRDDPGVCNEVKRVVSSSRRLQLDFIVHCYGCCSYDFLFSGFPCC